MVTNTELDGLTAFFFFIHSSECDVSVGFCVLIFICTVKIEGRVFKIYFMFIFKKGKM